jgi:hypothetical protein
MALGHFLGAFINDAFLGTDSPKNFFFSVEPSKKDIYASVRWIFELFLIFRTGAALRVTRTTV